MNYREFFRVEIDHQYFQPGECAELRIVPDQATHRFLKGRRLIFKEMVNGIRVLVPVDEAGSAIPVFNTDDLFTFKVFPTSTTFRSFTAMPDMEEGELLSFTNATLLENDTELVASVSAGSGTLHGFPLIAAVTIQIGDFVLDANNVPTTPNYKIVFNSRAEKWRYYFVSDPETTDFSIQDVNEELVFNNVAIQTVTDDKILTSLQSNFPDANLFLFESETPVAFRSQAINKLQLIRNEDIIVNHLPNPDPKDINFKIIQIHK